MATITGSMDKHPRAWITSLAAIVGLMVVSCALNGIIPVCHFLFRCDHSQHALESSGLSPWVGYLITNQIPGVF